LSPQRILMAGGRLPGAVHFARSLARAGHRVFVAETASRHLCRSSRAVERCFKVPSPNESREKYVDALIRIIADEKIDLLIPTFEETFHIAQSIDAIRSHCSVFCEELPRLDVLHNKWKFHQLLQEFGFQSPKSTLLSPSDDQRECLEEWLEEEDVPSFYLKPIYSRFSACGQAFPNGLTETSLLPDMSDRAWIAQEFLKGRELCTYSVAHEGRLTAHATYPLIFSFGGAAISYKSISHPVIDPWVEEFVRKYSFTGQICFDFIEKEDGEMLPLECNPRMTGGVHLLTNVPDFPSTILSDDERPTVIPKRRGQCIKPAMMIFGLLGIRSLSDAKAWIANIILYRDVHFRLTDPLLFFEQFLSFASFLLLRLKHKNEDLREVMTRDIQWDGDQKD
jgi:hypothetical protein